MCDGQHLTAGPVANHEIAPGLAIEAWGYNGTTPGPLIEVVQGDKVRIYVTNNLAANDFLTRTYRAGYSL